MKPRFIGVENVVRRTRRRRLWVLLRDGRYFFRKNKNFCATVFFYKSTIVYLYSIYYVKYFIRNFLIIYLFWCYFFFKLACLKFFYKNHANNKRLLLLLYLCCCKIYKQPFFTNYKILTYQQLNPIKTALFLKRTFDYTLDGCFAFGERWIFPEN